MASIVKCLYCKQPLNRDKEPYIKVPQGQNNRYAHEECFYKNKEKNGHRRELTDLIQKLYKPYEPDWSLIGKQIALYESQGYTLIGMRLTLEFVYVIMKQKLDRTKGIGIIPYKYRAAQKYYEQQNNIYIKAEEMRQYNQNINPTKSDIVTVENPKRTKKLIDFHY